MCVSASFKCIGLCSYEHITIGYETSVESIVVSLPILFFNTASLCISLTFGTGHAEVVSAVFT